MDPVIPMAKAIETRQELIRLGYAVAHGQMDPVIPMAKAIETRQELIRLGYAVGWHEYPMQHTVCADEIQEIRSWLLQILE